MGDGGFRKIFLYVLNDMVSLLGVTQKLLYLYPRACWGRQLILGAPRREEETDLTTTEGLPTAHGPGTNLAQWRPETKSRYHILPFLRTG